MASEIPPPKSTGDSGEQRIKQVGKLGEHTIVQQASTSDLTPPVPKLDLYAGGDFKHQISLAWQKGVLVVIQLILHRIFGFEAPDLSFSVAQAAPKLYQLQSEKSDSADVQAVMDHIFPNVKGFEEEWKLLASGEREQFYKKLEEASQQIKNTEGEHIPHFEEEKKARFDQLEALKQDVKGAIIVDLRREFDEIKRGSLVSKPIPLFDFYKKMSAVEKNIGGLAGLKEEVQQALAEIREKKVKQFRDDFKQNVSSLSAKQDELQAIIEELDEKREALAAKNKEVKGTEETLKKFSGRDLDKEKIDEELAQLEDFIQSRVPSDDVKKATADLADLKAEEADLIERRDSVFSRYSAAHKERHAVIGAKIEEAQKIRDSHIASQKSVDEQAKKMLLDKLESKYSGLKAEKSWLESNLVTQKAQRDSVFAEVEALRKKMNEVEKAIEDIESSVNQHVSMRKQEIEPLARLIAAEFIFEEFQKTAAGDKENSTAFWQSFISKNRPRIRSYVESQFIKLYGFINPVLKGELDNTFNRLLIV